jgi:hypothetical protein
MRAEVLRLRITETLSGSIDGIQLSRFQAGYVYELGTTLGNYLLALGAAEPVVEDVPVSILPPDKLMFAPTHGTPASSPVSQAPAAEVDPFEIAEAADRPRPSKRNPKRKRTRSRGR